MQLKRPSALSVGFALAPLLSLPTVAEAATVMNPLCPIETAIFAPDQGKDIIVPEGFTVSVFASGLNAPTGIAFLGNKNKFQVFVLESGHGIPSRCNDEAAFQTAFPGKPNPFTPDVLVFDQSGTLLRTLGKPTDATSQTGGTNVFQPHGPATSR